MAIVTRLGKGSKLTIEEMDNNLLSLETDISGNVSSITSKLDKGSYTGTAKDLENAITASVSAITSKLDKGTYTGSAKDLENAITAAVTGASGISITPTSLAPAGTGIASFTATQAGTYTNYGGVVVAANSFAIISRSAAGVFSISQTALVLPDSKILNWTAKAYLSGDQVNYLGKDWTANAATVAGDVPGTSTKWIDRLSGYAKATDLVINSDSISEINTKLSGYSVGTIAKTTTTTDNNAFDVIQQELGNKFVQILSFIDLRIKAGTGNVTLEFCEKSETGFTLTPYSSTLLAVTSVDSSGNTVKRFSFNEVQIRKNTWLRFTSTSSIFIIANKGTFLTQYKVGGNSAVNTTNLCYFMGNTTETINEKLAKIPLAQADIVTNANDILLDKENLSELNSKFYGLTDTTVASIFNSSTVLNVSRLNIILKQAIKLDNSIITGIRFKTAAQAFKLSVVSWNGIEGSGSVVVERTSISKILITNTYYPLLDLGSTLIANKGEYLMLSVAACNTSEAEGTDFITLDNSLNYTATYLGGCAVEYFYTVKESYSNSIAKLSDTRFLTNLLPITLTDSATFLSKSSVLNVEKVAEGIRIFGNGDGDKKNVTFSNVDVKPNRNYLLYAEVYYNTEPKNLNGNGFMLSNDANLGPQFAANFRSPVNGIGVTQIWSVIVNSSTNSGQLGFMLRAYPKNGAVPTDLIIDIVIKKAILLDLGESTDYFYNKTPSYFEALLANRKPFDVLNIENTSEITVNSNSLYKGMVMKSLGDSMPETRSYQPHIANAIGANYNGDPAGSYSENGTTYNYLTSVIGGTWCAPVTTPGGGTQLISQSAFIRARFLKYQKPDILLIQTGTNDAAYFSSVYNGKNPDGTTPYNYGLNDLAYSGNGADVSNGIYQDANGINISPSLGASYRGMLKQIFTDMPSLIVKCIGIPKAALTIPNSPTYNANYASDTIQKNAVIKKVAEEFSCDYIDLFNKYGVNNQTINTLTIDGIHYSNYGGKRVAMLILGSL
jgi:lysophospholipase L1-like esterase